TQYSAAIVQLLLQFWWCTQYTIQCSVVLHIHHIRKGHQGEADAHRPLKDSKLPLCLQSTVGVGHACHFFSAAGRVIEPEHAEELVEWITKPSSSSVTQPQSSLPSNAAAKAAYFTGSLSTVTPSIAQPSCTKSPNYSTTLSGTCCWGMRSNLKAPMLVLRLRKGVM
ncbi:hypothetical protein AB205_0039750, partial [Aquarana catesbeiana]